MRVGDPCPCCGRPLSLRKWPGPRQGGRRAFAYCAHDEAAWEVTADEQPMAGAARLAGPRVAAPKRAR